MNLWSKISSWWKSVKQRCIGIDGIDNPIQQATRTDLVKECTRDQATKARVAKAFKAQQQQMQARAMKPHDPNCEDPLTCTKKICFIREPDKIVDKLVVSETSRRKGYVRRVRMRRISKDSSI